VFVKRLRMRRIFKRRYQQKQHGPPGSRLITGSTDDLRQRFDLFFACIIFAGVGCLREVDRIDNPFARIYARARSFFLRAW
jgi:hypothetical protein